ncbi:MAG: hypothetical protein LBJ90_09065 [Treponema sp.]|jgi:hypothetical protein|nr:hypothetical protein [Treponema sp.]
MDGRRYWEGRAEGIAESRKESARKMKALRISGEIIAAVFDLDPGETERL